MREEEKLRDYSEPLGGRRVSKLQNRRKALQSNQAKYQHRIRLGPIIKKSTHVRA